MSSGWTARSWRRRCARPATTSSWPSASASPRDSSTAHPSRACATARTARRTTQRRSDLNDYNTVTVDTIGRAPRRCHGSATCRRVADGAGATSSTTCAPGCGPSPTPHPSISRCWPRYRTRRCGAGAVPRDRRRPRRCVLRPGGATDARPRGRRTSQCRRQGRRRPGAERWWDSCVRRRSVRERSGQCRDGPEGVGKRGSRPSSR